MGAKKGVKEKKVTCVILLGDKLNINNSVGFGTRFVTVDGQQIKLQIWDTVSFFFFFSCVPCVMSLLFKTFNLLF